jgi:NADH-quinone oxidoreductase subunit C
MTQHPEAPGSDKKPEPARELSPGPMGQFLKELGIKSTRLPDCSGSCGKVETICVEPADLEQAMRRLRFSPEANFSFLVMVSGVDSPETFDSVYHLWSYEEPEKELVLKVSVPKSSVVEGRLPAVPSLAPFWPAADWHEREEYDLVGIKYYGHPYLRRLMNPWDWKGHPLRRDYQQPVDALNDKNPHSMR